MKHPTFLFFVAIANCLYMSITYLVSLIPVMLIFYQKINLTGNFGLILLFVPIAFVIRFSLQILTGFTAFWLTEGSGSNHLMQNLENSLSGSMFPLYILPNYFTFYNLHLSPSLFTTQCKFILANILQFKFCMSLLVGFFGVFHSTFWQNWFLNWA